MKKHIIYILLSIFLMPNAHSQVSEIVNTYNLYFTSKNLKLEKSCLQHTGPRGGNWDVITMNGENQIICGERFDAWDYNVFDFFEEYNEFISPDLISKFESKFIFNESDELEPTIVKDFFNHLRTYIVSNFDSTKHFYIVYNESYKDEAFKYFFVWERVKIGESHIKIRTTHTTYDKKERHNLNFEEWQSYKGHYELIYENSEKQSEWLKIPEEKVLELGDQILLFEKIDYRSFLLHRIDKILAICEIAIERDLKIKRNSDWF